MTKDEWNKIITKQTKKLNTYQSSFEPVIETLATILEKRDVALEDFEDSGGEVVTAFVSDRGATNMKKNPRLVVWQDLNTQALAYWRELGLTPAGLKKLNDMLAASSTKKSGLEEALVKLGG